jgi:hypothetical protein
MSDGAKVAAVYHLDEVRSPVGARPGREVDGRLV